MILEGLTVAAVLWVAPATASPVVEAPTPADVVPEPWRSLAACESDRTWDADTGNGYRGGLQWKTSTWLAVKPDGAPDDPARASAAQEVAAGERLLAEPWGGWHHWPVCSRKVGLR